jgi:UDP-GlcNAc:undecaprenyl-phosphate GlcNAc-1-phosphate transferase
MKINFDSQISRSFYLFTLFLALVLIYPPTRSFFSEIGKRWLYILFLSTALSFCLTPLSRFLALRWKVVDKPDGRKVHQEATPLLGGAAVFIAFVTAILVNDVYTVRLFVIIGVAALLFILGIADDSRGVSASFRLLFQVLGTALVMYFGIILDVLPVSLGPFAKAGNITLTFFWVIGITNAMNFFDGMDGLAAGLGAIVSLFLGIVAFQTNQPFLGWISVAMMGSCLGFLPYNFGLQRSASIFLGDAGSTVIGFTLACLSVYGEWAESNAVVSLASPFLIFWVLIFDMVHITVDRVVTRKVLNVRQWIEYVGKDHLHHRLADVLGGPKRSVLFIYLLALCLGTSAIVLRYARAIDAILLLLQACIIVALVTILERRGRSISNGRP